MFSIVAGAFLLTGTSALAQNKPSVRSFIASFEKLQQQLLIEKLFLHLDKPNYVSGDTIWFKAYLLQGSSLKPSVRSGLLYVELDDSGNKCVKRIMVPVVSGLSWGNIALNPEEIPEGNYTLRAYTNWMRNFGEDYVFKKQLYITQSMNPLLADIHNKQLTPGLNDSIRTSLFFTDINRKPTLLQNVQLKVTDGRHSLYHSKAVILDGKVSLDYILPEKIDTKELMIQVQDDDKKGNTHQLQIPVLLNRPEKTDLQFMPEGGNLVAGFSSLTGFKAIGENGKSVEVKGKIYNSKQELITDFRSIHKGMGSFEFTPESGESYTAVMELPGGMRKSYALPDVKSSGTTLSVRPKGTDSIEVTIGATPDLVKLDNRFYLIGQARNAVCYGAFLVFNKSIVHTTIAKSVFPAGVARFTLLGADKRPLNERMIYIDHHDQLRIRITPDRDNYTQHDSIALNLQVQVTDQNGHPVRGSFSLAVTDDNQVKCDSTADNLMSSMLLSSFLKGTIEDPGYYFNHSSPQTEAALDNLLLTQGWVGYDWEQISGIAKPPTFAAEREFAVHGTVTNIFNKPVAGAEIMLLSKKPALLLDTLTDENGRFTFKGFAPIDTASFLIQALNKHKKSFNVGINVDEFVPPVFTQTANVLKPWYLNTDTAMLQNLQSIRSEELALVKAEGGAHVLRQVTIVGKKIIKGSLNLNGPGEADQILNEKDMEKAGKKTLGDLLEEKVEGYHVSGLWSPSLSAPPMHMYYMIKDKKLSFIFDGVRLEENFRGTLNDYYQYVKSYLDYYTAEDIKGLEVMSSERYASKYASKHLTPTTHASQWAFIEITTRSGAGPYMKKTPGVYVYKPLPLSLPKKFYRPRYPVKGEPDGSDMRSTIHWEPNIVTDTAGCASVSFYSAGKPARYTVIIQGTDMKGYMGYQRATLTVK